MTNLNLSDIELELVTTGWITYLQPGRDRAYDTRPISANGDFGFMVKIDDAHGSKTELVAHERVIGYGSTLSQSLYMKDRTLFDMRRLDNGMPPMHNSVERLAQLC